MLARARMQAQRLSVDGAVTSPVDVVRHLVALQAQMPSATVLTVRARTAGLTFADVERERVAGTLVRTWLMRGTLHLVHAGDLDWLLPLLGPRMIFRGTARNAQLGLEEATLERSLDVLEGALETGPATRPELFAALASHGINPAGQRGIHVVQYAALRGLLHFGPDRDGSETWILRPRPEPVVDRGNALARLAVRFQIGYGPSDARDLAAWSGLTVAEAREARRLAEGDSENDARVGHETTVRLLPYFDPYLLGYADREHAVPSARANQVWTGGGYVLPTVVRDGRVVATWRSHRQRRTLDIEVTPFDDARLDDSLAAAVDAEVADVGRFLGLTARWRTA